MTLSEALVELKKPSNKGKKLDNFSGYANQTEETILYWLFSDELSDETKQSNYIDLRDAEWVLCW